MRTGLTQPKRLERLFGLVILAWLSCLRIGVWSNETKAMSLVRYGAEWLRNALRWHPDGLAEPLEILISPFSAPGAA